MRSLTVGDYECSCGYLVLHCCALHLGFESPLMAKQDRQVSNTCFALDVMYQFCAHSRSDHFGPETELTKMFYLATNLRAKDHKAKFVAALINIYKELFIEHGGGW